MTSPTPAVSAPPPWNEDRLRALVRAHKPFTPRLRRLLTHVVVCARTYYAAHEEYDFEAAITGAPNPKRLRIAARQLSKARREALVALGENPITSDILPQIDHIAYDA